jgi:hypothetical protein
MTLSPHPNHNTHDQDRQHRNGDAPAGSFKSQHDRRLQLGLTLVQVAQWAPERRYLRSILAQTDRRPLEQSEACS